MSLGTSKRVWVILEEQLLPDGEKSFNILAGTEDVKAINAALAALKLYKDNIIKSGNVDLTDIKTSVVEKINPVNQILDQQDDDIIDKLMSMVDEKR